MLRKSRLTNLTAMLAVVSALSLGCTDVVVKDEEHHQFTDYSTHSFLDSRIEFLEEKVREYPKRDDFQYKIAGIYFEKEDFRESAKHLRKAILLSPSNPKYHYHLGRIYLKMREVELAESSFSEATKHTQSGRYSGIHCALGLVKGLRKDLAGAEAEFEKAIAAEPDNPEPFYFLAAVCDMQGDRDKAVRNFREYLARGGQVFRSNTIFYLEKLGVIIDREAFEKAERAVIPVDPFKKG